MPTQQEFDDLTPEELAVLRERFAPEIVAEYLREQAAEIARLREENAFHRGFAAGRAEAAKRSPLLDRIGCEHRHSNGHTN